MGDVFEPSFKVVARTGQELLVLHKGETISFVCGIEGGLPKPPTIPKLPDEPEEALFVSMDTGAIGEELLAEIEQAAESHQPDQTFAIAVAGRRLDLDRVEEGLRKEKMSGVGLEFHVLGSKTHG